MCFSFNEISSEQHAPMLFIEILQKFNSVDNIVEQISNDLCITPVA